jgi:hypothetical protein
MRLGCCYYCSAILFLIFTEQIAVRNNNM